NAGLSPERALDYLRRIQHHQIRLNASEPVTGVSILSAEQTEVLNALDVKKPTAPQQLTLL
ncbi:MAG: IS1634 family transposase, partial [Candidatus Dechloromonas phosphoritropha]